MTVFVLEGPDFAGKSTLVERIRGALEARGETVAVTHTGPPDLLDAKPLAQIYLDAAASPLDTDHLIFDRLHVGELVYGPIFRGQAHITQTDLTMIDDVLQGRQAQLLYVRPPIETLIERFHGARGDDLLKQEEQLISAITAYDSLIGPDCSGPWQLIDGSTLSDSDLNTLIGYGRPVN
ncbi:hypothetical protein GSU68_19385 (plasmid) [Rathayibacter sp. VKM Ac-2759]|uniref:hypothetical protein n=1 Tax=Rathayibacter sp. VKM Ac-2759 TaxID=2609252 RepID=UPI0013169482|nr:hypothetical protein [Rathayibacter sp. VKM Ac-2759]QHC68881.1 hypothetical protein GSU68_19385 [Rathayibacter sp. VKM Ac-2759]